MKWFKRIVLLLLLALLGAAAFVVISYRRASAAPAWYKPLSLTPEQTEVAAKRVEDGVIRALNLANGARAHERAVARDGPRSTQPSPEEVLTFSEDEINAFLHKHVFEHGQKPPDTFPWDVELPETVSEPIIALKPDQILLAGTVSEFAKVLTLSFKPSIDADSRLDMNLSGIQLGTLPIPESFLSKQRTRVINALNRRLPAMQRSAQLNVTGAANKDTVEAATTLLLLHVLHHEPAAPVFFVRTQDGSYMPVRLTRIEVGDRTITFGLRVMDKGDRVATVDGLKAPYASQP